MPTCAASAKPRAYAPRRPRDTVLHRVLIEHLETLVAEARGPDGSGPGLPAYVERELRGVVSCGDPAAGFLRLRCDRCARELLCPFSCGARTACPSCATRRMEDLTARLSSQVLPEVPLRQWTVSFPFVLRRLMGADPKLLSSVHRSFVRLVFATMRASAPVTRGRCGAVSFLQRFDGSLGLDPHVHLICLDGVYAERPDGSLEFHDTGTPSQADVETVAVHLHGAIRRILLCRGLINPEGELVPHDSQVHSSLEQLYAAAARDLVSSGTLDDHGRPEIRRRWPRGAQQLGPRLVEVDGVNVHADLRIEAADLTGRERLVRYALRPPFAHQQLAQTPDGRIALALRKPRRNGDTHRFFTPLAFLRRLAWLIVPPRQHLVRYAGVLAARARWRSRVVPASPPDDEVTPLRARGACPPADDVGGGSSSSSEEPSAAGTSRKDSRSGRRTWPALLRRIYSIDVLACRTRGCGGRMRVISEISSPPVIRRILEHLDLPTEVPAFAPARGPPQVNLDFPD